MIILPLERPTNILRGKEKAVTEQSGRVGATLQEQRKCGVMSRRRGDDDGDRWRAAERKSLEKGWMSSESPSMPVQLLHTSVCTSHGGIAIADATGRACAHLSPPREQHLSAHTGHMPPNTSPLSSPSPLVSLSCLFLFLSPSCCL